MPCTSNIAGIYNIGFFATKFYSNCHFYILLSICFENSQSDWKLVKVLKLFWVGVSGAQYQTPGGVFDSATNAYPWQFEHLQCKLIESMLRKRCVQFCEILASH